MAIDLFNEESHSTLLKAEITLSRLGQLPNHCKFMVGSAGKMVLGEMLEK